VIVGSLIGGAITFGYLLNSYFFCLSQTNCRLAPEWIVALEIIGTSVGAFWGWVFGKIFSSMYQKMRVD
jgi:membrane protein YqaA with SNARE-associated domain